MLQSSWSYSATQSGFQLRSSFTSLQKSRAFRAHSPLGRSLCCSSWRSTIAATTRKTRSETDASGRATWHPFQNPFQLLPLLWQRQPETDPSAKAARKPFQHPFQLAATQAEESSAPPPPAVVCATGNNEICAFPQSERCNFESCFVLIVFSVRCAVC